jgi:two-component system, OmpR family, sensor histidine kinase VicK
LRRLKLYLLLFCIALAVPLGYLVLRTTISLQREEAAELRYFAETLFNEMEEELALFVQREEQRPVDAYSAQGNAGQGFVQAPYILGYLQNNPDGSHLALLPEDGGVRPSPAIRQKRLAELEKINTLFNSRRSDAAEAAGLRPQPHGDDPRLLARDEERRLLALEERLRQGSQPAPEPEAPLELKTRIQPRDTPDTYQPNVADRYLAQRAPKSKNQLGLGERRVEEITADQVKTMTKGQSQEAFTPDDADSPLQSLQEAEMQKLLTELELEKRRRQYEGSEATDQDFSPPPGIALPGMIAPDPAGGSGLPGSRDFPDLMVREIPLTPPGVKSEADIPARTFQAEVDPMQSVLIDDTWIFVFRRIVIANRIYRQGFVLEARTFLEHLLQDYFALQPMARFTKLSLEVMDQGAPVMIIGAWHKGRSGDFMLERSFARPFSFLKATLFCEKIPRSEGRQKLTWVTAILAGVILLGLLAIHQSVRLVVDLSERRAGFVSSVTHEIKTPLTNIRLYIEMLEQGMATDPKRRDHYYAILNSETARLSRLIQNVLEFSKLERKQRALNMIQGDMEDVLSEVTQLMHDKLLREGFTLRVVCQEPVRLAYDREVMIQVLLNLLENSIKFGKDSPVREITITLRPASGNRVKIVVSDTGPGIPRKALKRIFEDFYRVDNSLTRRTQGTGIGLALVLRFVSAMGGTVTAANNHTMGCCFTIDLPGTRANDTNAGTPGTGQENA